MRHIEEISAITFYKRRSPIPIYVLGLREDKRKGRKWYCRFVKGKIELGEDEISALRRELKEEFGVERVNIMTDLNLPPYSYIYDGTRIVVHPFAVELDPTEQVKTNEEFRDCFFAEYSRARESLRIDDEKSLLKKG